EEGAICVDGQNINTFTQRSLRDAVAFVPQRPFFFMDTVAENIAFGRDFSREEIQRAAEQAHAMEFITRLPKGFDEMIAEAAKNFSGGQQQRLAIARALVKKAPILVLDEATSALDALSEQTIKQALQELRGQVTQIVIAHRLSTIEDADKIIYLEHGQKVAEGNKEELLQSCPGFRHMWDTLSHGSVREPSCVT
ncbi:MAG: ATP-binding cassette domain-containing protein, partial [Chlamydiia bacterium]|nr:ATP-binding cassette domain-containing protein [Chlamydiia bacterium]